MRLIDADALRAKWVDAVGIYTGRDIVNSIDDASTVAPEMSPEEYSRHRERMCNQYYQTRNEADCPLYSVMAGCGGGWSLITSEAVAIIKEWAQEHPEEEEE